LFQDHGLDLCQTVRGLASAIVFRQTRLILRDILLSKLVTFQLRFHRMDRSRSHHAVIRVYDDPGNVIETHEHKEDFREL